MNVAILRVVGEVIANAGMYMLKRYAAEIMLELFIKALAIAASKTDTSFDDNLVDKVRAEKEALLVILKNV